MTAARTAEFDNDSVGEIDERIRARMACLPPDVQAHVVATYSTGGRDAREPQKHFSGVIRGVWKLVIGGMTQEESARLIALSVRRQRVSYKPCDAYGSGRRCPYGDECTHPHV